jgi:hypothetical protein
VKLGRGVTAGAVALFAAAVGVTKSVMDSVQAGEHDRALLIGVSAIVACALAILAVILTVRVVLAPYRQNQALARDLRLGRGKDAYFVYGISSQPVGVGGLGTYGALVVYDDHALLQSMEQLRSGNEATVLERSASVQIEDQGSRGLWLRIVSARLDLEFQVAEPDTPRFSPISHSGLSSLQVRLSAALSGSEMLS